MASRPRAGHKAERTPTTESAEASPQSPLDFALSVMRDESKPDALRSGMAKAVLPYLHTRGEQEEETDEARPPEPKSEPLSDLELARRIAHILTRGKERQEREAAKRSDGEATTAPHAPPANAGQLMPSAPISPNDERASRDDQRDPHAAYRWIR